MNYPYTGTSDGHTTALRGKFPQTRYAGLEFEFNQAWIKRNEKRGSLEAKIRAVEKAIQLALEQE